MADDTDIDGLAAQLYRGIALGSRRVKLLQSPGELTVPQRVALARLEAGPASSAELARIEQISPQAMGITLGSLESMGLVQRGSDPHDGRRVVMSLTGEGSELLRHKKDNRARQLAKILTEEFTGSELRALAKSAPLILRLVDRL